MSPLLVAAIVVAAMVAANLNMVMEVVCQYPVPPAPKQPLAPRRVLPRVRSVLRGKEKIGKKSPKKPKQKVSTMKMSSAMMA